MWGIIVALLSGVLMSVQGVFNTEVTKQTHSFFTDHLFYKNFNIYFIVLNIICYYIPRINY